MSEVGLAWGLTCNEQKVLESTHTMAGDLGSTFSTAMIRMYSYRKHIPHFNWSKPASSTLWDPHLVVELLLPGTTRWWLQLLQDSSIWMLQYA